MRIWSPDRETRTWWRMQLIWMARRLVTGQILPLGEFQSKSHAMQGDITCRKVPEAENSWPHNAVYALNFQGRYEDAPSIQPKNAYLREAYAKVMNGTKLNPKVYNHSYIHIEPHALLLSLHTPLSVMQPSLDSPKCFISCSTMKSSHLSLTIVAQNFRCTI